MYELYLYCSISTLMRYFFFVHAESKHHLCAICNINPTCIWFSFACRALNCHLHWHVIPLPQMLQLNSSENVKLVTMASIIGIPPAPVVRAVSENFTLVGVFHWNAMNMCVNWMRIKDRENMSWYVCFASSLSGEQFESDVRGSTAAPGPTERRLSSVGSKR